VTTTTGTTLELEDIQAGALHERPSPYVGAYLLLRIDDRADGRELVRRLQDWTFGWDDPGTGRHTLRARATDAAGNTQPDLPPWNRLGYGNNAIEVLYVDRR
jgi:hypothetical protein